MPIRSSEEYCHARRGIKARARVDARDSPAKAALLGFPTPAVTPAKDEGVLWKGLVPDRAWPRRRWSEKHDGENARSDHEYLAKGPPLEWSTMQAGDQVGHRNVEETRRGHGQEVRQDAGQVTDRESRKEHASDGRQS